MEPPGVSILDATQLSYTGDFDHQVIEIMIRVRLTRSEVENLQCLLDDLKNALSQIWPGCQVYPFGSIITGLGIKTSDIDCYIDLPPRYICGKVNAVKQARNVLKRDPRKFSQLFAITSANVPILKFVHRQTYFNCDINFSSLNGVKNSKLIAFLLNLDVRALPLAIIVKYWSKVYNFSGTNLLPNYALTMMVIFYLQIKSVLPSVAELQRFKQPDLVDYWNTAFDDGIVYKPNSSETLYELLGGFFNYYKNFNYEQDVISPFMGCTLNKILFLDPNKLPAEYRLYKKHLLNKVYNHFRLDSSMCIQDPFQHNRNCSVAVHQRLFQKIHSHFDFAAKMFNERHSKDFLKALLTMDTRTTQNESKMGVKTKVNAQNKILKKYKHFQPKATAQAKARARHHFNRWQMENQTQF